MTRQSSYYDLFGVSRSATANEIRIAYLALMKKYHPDAAGAGDAVAEQRVALLNRCYSVLKDPLKRAEYDGKLALKSREIQAVLRRQEHKIVQSPNTSYPRWAVVLLVFAAAGAAIAAQFGSQWQTDIGSSAAGLFGWSLADQHTAVMRPIPSGDVDRALRLATTISADRAVVISTDCFDAARSQANADSAQLCIIFDDAFLYWSDNGSGDTLPMYFRDEVTRMRHLSALAVSTDRAERRLDQLRDITFHELLAQLAPSQDPKPEPKSAPARPK
ncbi:MAG TPA: DnaJ domain-containing protein, partial [Sphingomicrobium sp.]|nr:DnaJ domain-containing protein [Sphingomicrobium sp.]